MRKVCGGTVDGEPEEGGEIRVGEGSRAVTADMK